MAATAATVSRTDPGTVAPDGFGDQVAGQVADGRVVIQGCYHGPGRVPRAVHLVQQRVHLDQRPELVPVAAQPDGGRVDPGGHAFRVRDEHGGGVLRDPPAQVVPLAVIAPPRLRSRAALSSTARVCAWVSSDGRDSIRVSFSARMLTDVVEVTRLAGPSFTIITVVIWPVTGSLTTVG